MPVINLPTEIIWIVSHKPGVVVVVVVVVGAGC